MTKRLIVNRIIYSDVTNCINKCKCISRLQRTRAEINKRIKVILSSKEVSPFANIPIEKKREILKELFVENQPKDDE